MKILILGGSGMLGHKLYQTLGAQFDTYATVRQPVHKYQRYGVFEDSRLVGEIRADDFASVASAVAAVCPDVVVNCIGIVKQDVAAKDPIASITVNSLFPHQVARFVVDQGARFIHLSTDCVFSGADGNYSEAHLPDPPDLYGRSKLLGEVEMNGCLTIRTSMIGRELSGSHGLVEWFLSQQNSQVRGFTQAIFSGFTTLALADVISRVIQDHPGLSGVWHVAAEPISKFDLLNLVKQTYGLAIEITADSGFVCDRSLNGTRFRDATGLSAPPWPEMIERMRADPTPYENIRQFT